MPSISARRNSGLSLVELLVVLGIIGVIAAVVIPTATFYTRQSSKDAGAREFFTAMKFASVYAGTHNVNTAVVFNIRGYDDSLTGERVYVLSEYLIARELKTDEINKLRPELAAHGITPPRSRTKHGPIYVPIDSHTTFKALDGNAGILGETFSTGLTDVYRTDAQGNIEYQTCIDDNGQVVYDSDGNPEQCPIIVSIPDLLGTSGMTRIRLINDIDHLLPVEVSAIGELPENQVGALDGHVPAYVWKPDGSLSSHSQFAKARSVVYVSPLPDEDIAERFVIDPDTGQIELDGIGNLFERHTPVSIFHSVGRVRVGQ